MRRLAALVIAGAAFAAAPAEARMAKTVLLSSAQALGLEGESGTDEAWSPAVQPIGLIEWVREFAQSKPRAEKPAQNDITATLEAMKIARIGFSDSSERRPTPAMPAR